MAFPFSLFKAQSSASSSAKPSTAPSTPNKGLSLMAKTTKNWKEALKPENGFKRIAGKPGGLSIMGKIEKNWQTAKKPENGFRQIAASKKLGLGIMAKVEKNWVEARKPESGFRQILGPKQPNMRPVEIEMQDFGSGKGQSQQRKDAFNGQSGQRKSGTATFAALEMHSASSRRRSAHGSLGSASSEPSEE